MQNTVSPLYRQEHGTWRGTDLARRTIPFTETPLILTPEGLDVKPPTAIAACV